MPRRKLEIEGRTLALDARPDRLDLRDRSYTPILGSLPRCWPRDADAKRLLPAYVAAGLIRDQGEDGACTGFGLAAVINYLQFVQLHEMSGARRIAKTAVRQASPAMLYALARLYDEWPGDDYEGSSCRGALKGWQRHGVCREHLWPYKLDKSTGTRAFVAPLEKKDRDDPEGNWDIDALQCTLGVYYRIDARSVVDMQAAIYQTGAIYCSATVHEGWAIPRKKKLTGHDGLPCITHTPSPKDPGGHAFALVGYNEDGFVVQNSWGTTWGASGFALLPYAEWVTHGDDAWVFSLGVPGARAASTARGRANAVARSPRYFVPAPGANDSATSTRPVGVVASADSFERKYRDEPNRPLDSNAAYRHALVLDRGFPVRNDISVEHVAGTMERIGYACPKEWLHENRSNKLLIYAHGGLNSENDSINRVRAMAPYAMKHGIYPIFVTWRSGTLETLSDLGEELLANLGFGVRGAQPATGWGDQIIDKIDRGLEPLMRIPGGAMWGQMKLNAVRASEHEAGGCRMLVQQLARLAKERPKLEIHLIGHSAGSIVLGSMLDELSTQKLTVSSTRLLAPACTVRFANRHYATAIKNGTLAAKRLHIHTLSNDNELDDNVGPYRKSLLYLVSRSFEDAHKMPILGLEKAFDRATLTKNAADDAWAGSEQAAVSEWLDFWNSHKVDAENRRAHTLSAKQVSTGTRSIRASHGCFDNAVTVIGDALGYIVNPDRPKAIKIDRLDY